jgi:hypothetical protein
MSNRRKLQLIKAEMNSREKMKRSRNLGLSVLEMTTMSKKPESLLKKEEEFMMELRERREGEMFFS